MLKTMINAWKVPELRKKLLYTFMMIIIFRFGSWVPIPFLNRDALAALMNGVMSSNSNTIFSFLNTFSGGAFQYATLFAMSVGPYITSSIIMQLMTVVLPSLERLTKEGEEGRKKMSKITRYLAVVLGILQGTLYYFYLRNNPEGLDIIKYTNGFEGFFTAAVIVMVLTAGTALMMWFGEQINQKGIGNGISILLFAGIVARMPDLVLSLSYYWNLAIEDPSANGKFFVLVPLFVLIFLGVIALIVLMNDAERRIPIQYAKRVVGRKMYGGQSTHMPIKIGSAGVMPIIFASTILAVPGTINQLAHPTGFWKSFLDTFSHEHAIYPLIYFILIIMFAYFYITITYNPMEMANNLRQSSGMIPGIRPGKPTSDFIGRVLSKITLIGALFLAFIALLPIFFGKATGMASMSIMGGTSIIILVGVALETVKQMESQMMMRHYKGFLD